MWYVRVRLKLLTDFCQDLLLRLVEDMWFHRLLFGIKLLILNGQLLYSQEIRCELEFAAEIYAFDAVTGTVYSPALHIRRPGNSLKLPCLADLLRETIASLP
ncbi:uncharacterized protein LOC124461821 isoform X1 [Drosophila willistoni]|uniref:uncharacterized protein LOC124461821 isoform X1 n=1 Tax=Drosophila willistoni TaxID=7260 RepID=UPI001F071711|nr:uncharacterized protein LOC124461821 isoform X1 [Drosophila willistoni]